MRLINFGILLGFCSIIACTNGTTSSEQETKEKLAQKTDTPPVEDDTHYETFLDERDGTQYKMVTIGNQTWMAENLRYNAKGSRLTPNNPRPEYGRLYDWKTLINGEETSEQNPINVQGICPEGWHIPNEEEWFTLVDSNDILSLKSKNDWLYNENGTNSSGFNAYPAGTYRDKSSGFNEYVGTLTSFWSSSKHEAVEIIATPVLSSNASSGILGQLAPPEFFLSCRCVKN